MCSQTEEENAALLAALTDSLDGMVDAEVGGLSVFPALEEEEPVQEEEEEEEESLPLGSGDLRQVVGAESEDPSLVRASLKHLPNDEAPQRSLSATLKPQQVPPVLPPVLPAQPVFSHDPISCVLANLDFALVGSRASKSAFNSRKGERERECVCVSL